MADTDKDTSRSVSGGDSPEPTVEVSETPSRSEAFRALISRGVQTSQSRMTLETRLGIITITILVFTFGFLIYRKVEVHQQRIAAQIPSQQETDAPEDELLKQALAKNAERSVDGFPSNSGTEDVFVADSVMPAAAGTLSEGDSTPNFSQPEFPPTLAMGNGFDEPAVGSQMSEPEFEADGTEPSASPFPSEQHDQPAGAFTESGMSRSTEVESAFLIASSSDSAPADFSSASDPSANPSSASHDVPAEDSPQSELPGVNFEQTEAPGLAFSVPPAATEGTDVENGVAGQSETLEDAASETTQPVLIAMLDPKPQENPFGTTEPQLPELSSAPASEPSFPPEFGSSDSTETHQAGSPFGDTPEIEVPEPSGGVEAFADPPTLNAVPADGLASDPFTSAQAPQFPSQSSTTQDQPRRTIFPAVATGPDGKFSLAAFNYQNNVPAPIDDGNTYDIHVVQEGDNYSRISKRIYGTSRYFSALAVFNQHRISDPKKMRPGMKIIVPPASLLEERYPQLFVEASGPREKAAPGFFLTETGSPAYRVGQRETLSEISERYLGRSSRWIEILRLNQNVLQDPNKLKPGTVLSLPEDAVEVNVSPQ
ncbi:MAG: LysM peptidoglycan-binding domain-containing protein [Planctomyces sp.]|nr:LysM peptidoglycan-binding domain-containing protein [Planctomyces sp.]